MHRIQFGLCRRLWDKYNLSLRVQNGIIIFFCTHNLIDKRRDVTKVEVSTSFKKKFYQFKNSKVTVVPIPFDEG